MSAPKRRGPYRVGLPSRRGCLTCRDRKISCDLSRPGCQNCASGGRNCKGYRLRLSWPAHGSRRMIEHVIQNDHKHFEHGAQPTHFINTKMKDFKLLYVHNPESTGKLPIRHVCLPPISNLENAQTSLRDGHHLVTFFMSTVVDSLTQVRYDGDRLRKLLFQLSFSDDSHASMAVLRVMLSLASLYRYGHSEQALQLKVATLKSLSASLDGLITTTEIYQHVAVGILLCAFETFLPSDTSFHWPLYVSGAKGMLHKICEGGHPKLMEVDQLVLLVHYHDIMARFTLRHCKIHTEESGSIYKVPGMASTLVTSVKNEQVLGIFGCSLEMLNLIARMAEFRLNHNMVDDPQHPDREVLKSIEHELKTVRQDHAHLTGSIPEEDVEHMRSVSQLYRIAGLIYFEHTLKISPSREKIATWSDEGFDLISKLEICERPFPLFLIASEAHTDEQRGIILSILEKSQRRLSQRRFYTLQEMIESMWVQQDLSSEPRRMDYIELMKSVTSCELLPSLA